MMATQNSAQLAGKEHAHNAASLTRLNAETTDSNSALPSARVMQEKEASRLGLLPIEGLSQELSI
jgi:hypothetical protein